MRHVLKTAALALVLATTAACSSDDPGPVTAAASPSPTGITFASTSEVIAQMGRNGLPCEDPEQGVVEGVEEAARCVVGGAEDAIVLRFADDAQKDAYLQGKDELASVVVGANWAVQTVLPQTAERVAGAVGGEVQLGSGG